MQQAFECFVVACFHNPAMVLAGVRTEVLMQKWSKPPRILVKNRALHLPRDAINLPLDKKAVVWQL